MTTKKKIIIGIIAALVAVCAVVAVLLIVKKTCDHSETIVTKEAVKPTCTEDGCTARIKCAKCKKVLQESEVISKLDTTGEGHKKVYASNGDGTHQVKCTRCSLTLDAAEACTYESSGTDGKTCQYCRDTAK